MRRVLQTIVVLGLALIVAAPLAAQEKGKKKKGGDNTPPQITNLKKQLAELDLTAEQKTKIETIMADHTGKLAAAQKKVAEVLTPEQRKARQEAVAKAKADGKKGKELQEVGHAALKLGPDAKEKLAAAEKEVASTVADLRKAVAGVLTDQQRAKAGLGTPAGKAKKKAG